MANIDYGHIESVYNRLASRYFEGIATRLGGHLKHFVDYSRIDKVTCRPKSLESFMKKSHSLDNVGNLKYSDPLKQIQDQIGARVVTFFKNDIPHIQQIVEKVYRRIEKILIVPDEDNQFGYESVHYVLLIPRDIVPDPMKDDEIPSFFELQVKTLFQHAWAQAEHDITYKKDYPWTVEQKRKVAFTAAQAWGADMIFNELYLEQKN
jgi:putative GTP pyrophosphokinase